MRRLMIFIKKLYYDKRIRFLFVGGLNTIVGVGVDLLSLFLLRKTGLDDNVNIVLASAIGTVIGTLHSYIWNKFFTFKSKKKSWAEALRFLLVYALVYGMGLGIQFGAKAMLGLENDSNWMYLIKAVSVLITTVISWFGHKYFSFIGTGKSNRLEPQAERDADESADRNRNDTDGEKNEKN